jgi:hypothetical protein
MTKGNVSKLELLEALKGLFDNCSMIHNRWGEGCNQKEADNAIRFAKAALTEGCSHNEMVRNENDNEHCFKCANCGYVYGK